MSTFLFSFLPFWHHHTLLLLLSAILFQILTGEEEGVKDCLFKNDDLFADQGNNVLRLLSPRNNEATIDAENAATIYFGKEKK